MGEKDITGRSLEWFNEVFADIVNVWLTINGVKGLRVKPEELTDVKARSAYKVGDEIREQERDVPKLWTTTRGKTLICLVGLENQTGIDTWMALRVLGYDGGDYALQLRPRVENGKRRRKKPHLVMTLVLYFGTKRRWPHRRSALDRLNAPEELRSFCSDTPLNVFELAWLTEEQEKLFTSDFRHVVHYLRQERLEQKFDMLPDEVQHAEELLDLLFALTKDHRFKTAIVKAREIAKRGGAITLRSFLEEAENRGRNEGFNAGRSEGFNAGRSEGFNAGRSEERRDIRNILIAGGMNPQELQARLIAGGMSAQAAANFAGL